VICREPEHEEAAFRKFRERQMARYRKMIGANLGDWYGAFIDRRLVADLGIFCREGLGRYQTVQTHPDFRRRGIAGMMVFEAALQAKEKFNLHTLVIIAEEDSAPGRLYQSLGFDPVERQVGLEWWMA
jgi:GNAT superfamily N-acetyltransferase